MEQEARVRADKVSDARSGSARNVDGASGRFVAEAELAVDPLGAESAELEAVVHERLRECLDAYAQRATTAGGGEGAALCPEYATLCDAGPRLLASFRARRAAALARRGDAH
jgi:hypothetical protein